MLVISHEWLARARRSSADRIAPLHPFRLAVRVDQLITARPRRPFPP
jgi:hypothetical protein